MSKYIPVGVLIVIMSVLITIMTTTVNGNSEHRKTHNAKCGKLDGIVVYQKTKSGIHRTLCLNKNAIHYVE